MNLLASFVFISIVHTATSVMFHIKPNQKKCLKDEVHKDVLVKGEYSAKNLPSEWTVKLQVVDSKGHTLYKKESIREVGKFAFTTDDYEMFEVCFECKSTYRSDGLADIELILKHGIEAKNYDDIEKAEKLRPMEVELRRLEDLSESIVNDFSYMKKREEQMRDTNASTNDRVLYFSVFSMLCLLGLATWQVFYLRHYFKSKKLID